MTDYVTCEKHNHSHPANMECWNCKWEAGKFYRCDLHPFWTFDTECPACMAGAPPERGPNAEPVPLAGNIVGGWHTNARHVLPQGFKSWRTPDGWVVSGITDKAAKEKGWQEVRMGHAVIDGQLVEVIPPQGTGT